MSSVFSLSKMGNTCIWRGGGGGDGDPKILLWDWWMNKSLCLADGSVVYDAFLWNIFSVWLMTTLCVTPFVLNFFIVWLRTALCVTVFVLEQSACVLWDNFLTYSTCHYVLFSFVMGKNARKLSELSCEFSWSLPCWTDSRVVSFAPDGPSLTGFS